MSNNFTHVLQELCPDFFVPPALREPSAVAWELLEPAARWGVAEEVREVTGSQERFFRLMVLLGVTKPDML